MFEYYQCVTVDVSYVQPIK